MTFGEKVQALRRREGWTQKELAERLGVSMRTIVSYERGESYPKQRGVYDRLSELFRVDKNALLMEDASAGEISMASRGAAFDQAGEGRAEAERLVREVSAMFAGGSLTEADRDAVMRALQDAYWEARGKESR